MLYDKNMQAVSFDKFYNMLVQFEYSVNKRELRIDDIFVDNFNSHAKDTQAFSKEKKESFAKAIINRL